MADRPPDAPQPGTGQSALARVGCVSDTQHAAVAPETSRFVAELAARPLLVVGVTFAISAVVTAVLMLVAWGMDVTAAVTTLVGVWALVLALVIYLLTARDTDRLLSHIDALQDQLSAVLETPGADAEVIDTAAAQPQPTAVPAISPVNHLEARMPPEYVDALRQVIGTDVDKIRRAWTPIPNGHGPWVVENVEGDRWSVFRAGHGRPTVVPLGNPEQRRQQLADRRQRQRQNRADLRRAKMGQGDAGLDEAAGQPHGV